MRSGRATRGSFRTSPDETGWPGQHGAARDAHPAREHDVGGLEIEIAASHDPAHVPVRLGHGDHRGRDGEQGPHAIDDLLAHSGHVDSLVERARDTRERLGLSLPLARLLFEGHVARGHAGLQGQPAQGLEVRLAEGHRLRAATDRGDDSHEAAPEQQGLGHGVPEPLRHGPGKSLGPARVVRHEEALPRLRAASREALPEEHPALGGCPARRGDTLREHTLLDHEPDGGPGLEQASRGIDEQTQEARGVELADARRHHGAGQVSRGRTAALHGEAARIVQRQRRLGGIGDGGVHILLGEGVCPPREGLEDPQGSSIDAQRNSEHGPVSEAGEKLSATLGDPRIARRVLGRLRPPGGRGQPAEALPGLEAGRVLQRLAATPRRGHHESAILRHPDNGRLGAEESRIEPDDEAWEGLDRVDRQKLLDGIEEWPPWATVRRRPRRRSRPARASSERRACHARRDGPGSGDGFASNPEGEVTRRICFGASSSCGRLAQPPRGGVGLTSRCLIYPNVAQERNFPCRPPATARGRRSPSRVGGGAHSAARGRQRPAPRV
jgi:hypothetical protein